MPLDIRPIDDLEFATWWEAMRVGFLGHAADGEADLVAPGIDLSRVLGAFDGGRVVATLRSFASDLVVPGGARLPTSALTNVTVSPTHRRRGLLTDMLTRDLAAAADRGEVLSSLIAAEYPIYGRFGYGPAVAAVDLTVDATARFRDDPPPGSVELVDAATLRADAPAVYERARDVWPGALARDGRKWDLLLGIIPWPDEDKKPRFHALSRDAAGRPDGFVTYRTESHWHGGRPLGTLHVEDLVGVDAAATARLWRYCLDVDWIAKVEATNRGVDELLPWLLVDARMIAEHDGTDLEWVRILDPVAALEGRRYLCPGVITLEITDPQGLARGRFTLDGGPDGATCCPTTVSADLELGVDVLGAAYLGGYRLQAMAEAGLVDELRPGALGRADAMFRSPRSPYSATFY